jgi:hypothetical protein
MGALCDGRRRAMQSVVAASFQPRRSKQTNLSSVRKRLKDRYDERTRNQLRNNISITRMRRFIALLKRLQHLRRTLLCRNLRRGDTHRRRAATQRQASLQSQRKHRKCKHQKRASANEEEHRSHRRKHCATPSATANPAVPTLADYHTALTTGNAHTNHATYSLELLSLKLPNQALNAD